MAGLIVGIFAVVMAGVAAGAFLALCFGIRRDDRRKWSLRRNPPSSSTRIARSVVGLNGSSWK